MFSFKASNTLRNNYYFTYSQSKTIMNTSIPIKLTLYVPIHFWQCTHPQGHAFVQKMLYILYSKCYQMQFLAQNCYHRTSLRIRFVLRLRLVLHQQPIRNIQMILPQMQPVWNEWNIKQNSFSHNIRFCTTYIKNYLPPRTLLTKLSQKRTSFWRIDIDYFSRIIEKKLLSPRWRSMIFIPFSTPDNLNTCTLILIHGLSFIKLFLYSVYSFFREPDEIMK